MEDTFDYPLTQCAILGGSGEPMELEKIIQRLHNFCALKGIRVEFKDELKSLSKKADGRTCGRVLGRSWGGKIELLNALKNENEHLLFVFIHEIGHELCDHSSYEKFSEAYLNFDYHWADDGLTVGEAAGNPNVLSDLTFKLTRQPGSVELDESEADTIVSIVMERLGLNHVTIGAQLNVVRWKFVYGQRVKLAAVEIIEYIKNEGGRDNPAFHPLII